jgi:uncharacterized protein YpmB
MNYQLTVKLTYLIIFIILFLAIIISGIFLYTNFYKTYTQTGKIENLETQVARDVVNTTLWQQVTKAQDKKATSVIPPEPARNPFTFGSTAEAEN